MLKTTQQRRTPSSTVIAFEPRQVTLARHQNMKKSDSSKILQNGSIDETLKSSKKGKSKKKKSKSSSKTDVPAPLLRSIAAYLEHIGFSKTLAAFRAEASITDEDGDSKVIPLDLEMYYKYLEASKSDLKATINGTEELGLDNALSAEKSITENDTEENKPEAPVESIKKKRKKSKENDAAVVEEHPIDNKKITNDAKEDNGKSTNEVVSELQIKSREKKKKSKRAADSLHEDAQEVDTEALGNQVDNSVSESQPDMSDKKPKKKKKTKFDSMLDEGNATAEVLLEETKDKTDGKKKKSKSTTTDETFEQGTKENTNAVGVEKKSSKKRKRLTSEEQESQPEDDILPKEARKSNTEVLDDNKDQQQKGNQLLEVEEHAGKKRKTENSQVVGQIKGDLEDNDLVQNRREGSAPQKSSKKQHGSAEPKTVNAFQRVKIEKVEFADDRLQDNSYWAKDGAEIGYGAKAQEVLGQVRGRDFRHEKTKKKRGSYRGGQIDMQSHSVKFKDSDDE